MIHSVRIGLVAIALLVLHHSALAEENEEKHGEKDWYAGQMGGVYAATIGLGILGAATEAPALAAVGSLGWLLGPPLLHAVHGSSGAAGAGFLLRAVYVGGAFLYLSECWSLFGSDETSGSCRALTAGMVASLIGAIAVDFALAYENVDRRSRRLTLVAVPPGRTRPGLVGLGGTF